MAGRRNQEITYRLFYDGKPVDRLPDGYAEAASAHLSKWAGKYFQQHPEKLENLEKAGYAKRIPRESLDKPLCG